MFSFRLTYVERKLNICQTKVSHTSNESFVWTNFTADQHARSFYSHWITRFFV